MTIFEDAKPLVMMHSPRSAFRFEALKAPKWINKYFTHDRVALIPAGRITRFAIWLISANQVRCLANAFHESLSKRLSR